MESRSEKSIIAKVDRSRVKTDICVNEIANSTGRKWDHLFNKVDTDKSGSLDLEEIHSFFDSFMTNPHVIDVYLCFIL